MTTLITPLVRNKTQQRCQAFIRKRSNDELSMTSIMLGVFGVMVFSIGFINTMIWWNTHNKPADEGGDDSFSLVVTFFLLVIPVVLNVCWFLVRWLGAKDSIKLDYDRYAYGDRSSENRIITGFYAFWMMEPVLQVESRQIYRTMYRALQRWEIANEDMALQQAAKRGLLLSDIHREGKMTRASQIPLDDDDDLTMGREVISQLMQIRRELEQ